MGQHSQGIPKEEHVPSQHCPQGTSPQSPPASIPAHVSLEEPSDALGCHRSRTFLSPEHRHSPIAPQEIPQGTHCSRIFIIKMFVGKRYKKSRDKVPENSPLHSPATEQCQNLPGPKTREGRAASFPGTSTKSRRYSNPFSTFVLSKHTLVPSPELLQVTALALSLPSTLIPSPWPGSGGSRGTGSTNSSTQPALALPAARHVCPREAWKQKTNR